MLTLVSTYINTIAYAVLPWNMKWIHKQLTFKGFDAVKHSTLINLTSD